MMSEAPSNSWRPESLQLIVILQAEELGLRGGNKQR